MLLIGEKQEDLHFDGETNKLTDYKIFKDDSGQEGNTGVEVGWRVRAGGGDGGVDDCSEQGALHALGPPSSPASSPAWVWHLEHKEGTRCLPLQAGPLPPPEGPRLPSPPP